MYVPISGPPRARRILRWREGLPGPSDSRLRVACASFRRTRIEPCSVRLPRAQSARSVSVFGSRTKRTRARPGPKEIATTIALSMWTERPVRSRTKLESSGS